MTTEYLPTAKDIQWAKDLLAGLRTGGVWYIPKTESMYLVYHETKTLELADTPNTEDANRIHKRSKIVFAELGYEVRDAG